MYYLELGTFAPNWLGDVVAVVKVTPELFVEISRTVDRVREMEQQGSHPLGVRLNAWGVWIYRADTVFDVEDWPEDLGERVEIHTERPYEGIEEIGAELLVMAVSEDDVMWEVVPKGGSSRDYIDTTSVDVAELRAHFNEADERKLRTLLREASKGD